MVHIIDSEPRSIWPRGDGVYPKVTMLKLLRYRPGASKHSHWLVKTFNSENDDKPQTSEFETWKELDRTMTEQYGKTWSKDGDR